MGIKSLNVLLNQKCSCAINQRKLNTYGGMILGIDISIFLYKYLYGNDNPIEGLTKLIMRLMKNNVVPFFVFDGKPPKEKNEVLQMRRERKDYLNVKKNIVQNSIKVLDENNNITYDEFKSKFVEYIENNNYEYTINENEIREQFEKKSSELKNDYEKISKKIIYITPQHIEKCKKLFDLFGLSYIVSPTEAETLLSVLCRENYIDAVVSEDMDVLPTGGHLFLRNFNSDNNMVDEYCLDGILHCLEITFEQFIDLCILCGSDYTSKIDRMGPMTAYKYIKRLGNIENILEEWTRTRKYIIPQNFDYQKARSLFTRPINEIFIQNVTKEILLNKPKLEELNQYLLENGVKEKFIKEVDKNLINYHMNIEHMMNF